MLLLILPYLKYNTLGQAVRTFESKDCSAGTYRIEWDGRDDSGRNVVSGIYFYRLKTESFFETKKMILVK